MDADILRILDFAEQVQRVGEPGELIDQFRWLVQFLGFEHFVITGLPWQGWEFEALVVARNFPDEWVNIYITNEYLREDAVARAGLTSITPFTWHKAIARFGHTEMAQKIASESNSFGLVDGVTFPFIDPLNRAAMASIVTDRKVDIAPYVAVVLQGVIPYVYNRYHELVSDRRPVAGQLSPREVQVLRLISAGGTLDLVADKLHLSKSTVRYHLERARGKLGGTSLPHTVATAIRTRQI